MTYLVLALKWRPQRFAEVAGQEPVSRTLSNALRSGRAAHAYLFTGPRGVGKTSMARILAKAINCARAAEDGPRDEPCNECGPCREITAGRSMDVIEIDGASNRGIDDIRELRESVRYAPASLSRKVYIIDEVHMLTQDAFNALLKTLEEPPAHVVFVLATTEPLKVPQTIVSRCQRFDFARLGPRTVSRRLREICDAEGIAADDEALFLMGRKAEGAMRDGLTFLDQVLAGGPERISVEVVREALGVAGRELFFEWSEAIAERDAGRALRSLSEAIEGGANLLEMADEFLAHLRNLLYVATDPSLAELIEATDEEIERYRQQASRIAAADLLRYCRMALETGPLMRRSGVPRAHLEVSLAEMCALPNALDLRRFIEAVKDRADAGGAADLAAAPGGVARVSGGAAGRAAGGTTGGAAGRGAGGATGGAAGGASAGARTGSATGRSSRASGGAAPKGSSGSDPAAYSASPPAPGFADRPHPPAPGLTAFGSAREAGTPPSTDGADAAANGASKPAPSAAAVATDATGWEQVYAAVAARSKALTATLEGSAALGETDRFLRVGVRGLTDFKRAQLEKNNNRQLLMELIQAAYGRPLGVRFEELPPGAAAPGAATGTRDGLPEANGSSGPGSASAPAGRSGPAADRGNGRDNGLVAAPEDVRRVADLFGGDVLGPA